VTAWATRHWQIAGNIVKRPHFLPGIKSDAAGTFPVVYTLSAHCGVNIAVMKLFIMSMRIQSPAVLECISLPCLRILQHIINPSPPASKKNKVLHLMCIIIIIIITNEKIKVMLSRKRCRGTLQDYNKGEISKCRSKLWTNRNVFSWCLNGTREETEEMVVDCSMHAVQRRGKHDPPG